MFYIRNKLTNIIIIQCNPGTACIANASDILCVSMLISSGFFKRTVSTDFKSLHNMPPSKCKVTMKKLHALLPSIKPGTSFSTISCNAVSDLKFKQLVKLINQSF